uniref:Uncharacterized protein n=1 Tax=Timema cristinae TaxID=61476 RepID=A0A7R9D9U9_TIMCR|nr:unnamed protein product [Timema cristinae]
MCPTGLNPILPEQSAVESREGRSQKKTIACPCCSSNTNPVQWSVSEHRSSYSSLRLSDHFNRPEIIEEGENFDHLIRGMTTQSQECTDQYFTSEVSVHMIRVRRIHNDQYFTSEVNVHVITVRSMHNDQYFPSEVNDHMNRLKNKHNDQYFTSEVNDHVITVRSMHNDQYFTSEVNDHMNRVKNKHNDQYFTSEVNDHMNRVKNKHNDQYFTSEVIVHMIVRSIHNDQYFTSEFKVHMIRVRSIPIQQYFTSEITRYLFRNGKETGQDLRAIDIQRGRDHGLASYNDYRHYCGLHRADKFSDFGDYISQEDKQETVHIAQKLQLNIYSNFTKALRTRVDCFAARVSNRLHMQPFGDLSRLGEWIAAHGLTETGLV